MSQIYKSLSSGPVPPSVATSYVTDNGTAVPSANILIVDAFDSIENNANGLTTKGGVAAGDPPGTGTSNEVSIYLTNRISITATTSDGGGQTQTVKLMTPTDGTAVTFDSIVVGYDAINNIGIGGQQVGIARKAAGVAVIVGTNDTFDESDAALNAVDWNVVASGGDLDFQFVGIAGHTINWKVVFEYVQAP